MFTRDSVIISHNIKTPLTSISRAVGNILQLTYGQLVKSLFANNEQGFAYDPNDLSTMFQDAAGTVPVTGAGQPVGLMLDKSKGMTLGAELLTNGDFSNGAIGWSTVAGSLDVVNNTCTVTATTAGAIRLGQPITTVVGKTYRVSVTILSLSAGGGVVARAGASLGAMGATNASYATTVAKTMTMYFVATSTDTVIYMNMTSSAIGQKYSVTGFTCKELAGNHAYQTTSSMRPLLIANPQRLDYDTVDDKLITNLPAQLTGCTVIRAVPNVGTQILTNQPIPTTYNDNKDHCGLIVINRALTATETSQITRIFNKAAGV